MSPRAVHVDYYACRRPMQSSSAHSPGGDLDTSKTWSRNWWCSHKLLLLQLCIVNIISYEDNFRVLLSLIDMFLTELGRAGLATGKWIHKRRARNMNTEMTSKINLTIEKILSTPFAASLESTIDPYHLKLSWGTRLLLGNSWVLIEFWQFFFNFNLMLPVPVEQAWVINQKMILRRHWKVFFVLIFTFGCHLRIKCFKTKRFWYDVFVRVINVTEHSLNEVRVMAVYWWILQSNPLDWRMSTYQLNKGMNESSPVNHLSSIDIKL